MANSFELTTNLEDAVWRCLEGGVSADDIRDAVEDAIAESESGEHEGGGPKPKA